MEQQDRVLRLDNPGHRLTRIEYPFLREPSKETERLARPGSMPPTRSAQLGFAPDQDPSLWPALPARILLAFTGDVCPVLLESGRQYYRVVGDGQYANGSFWTSERPTDEDKFRRDYALPNAWNGDHGLVALEIVRPIPAWCGHTGPQRCSDRSGYLPGGSQQLWVPAGSLQLADGRWTLEQF